MPFEWVPICIFYNHLKTCLLIISHRAFTAATFKRIKLMKHSNFYILTFCALGEIPTKRYKAVQVGVSLLLPKWITSNKIEKLENFKAKVVWNMFQVHQDATLCTSDLNFYP